MQLSQFTVEYMSVNIQKFNAKTEIDGQVRVSTEVLEALGALPSDDLEFAIYSDGVMLRAKNSHPIKVSGLEEAQENSGPFNEHRFPERYTYYWSLRD